jgi:glycine/D-amino acid oxidase-like deaminating enzyme
VTCESFGDLREYPYWWDTRPGTLPGTRHAAPGTLHAARHPAPGTQHGTQHAAPSTRHPIELPPRVDVAIVGAGYTGLAAARHLAHAGAAVLVLEREHTGWGASSRNGGQVLTGLKLDPAALVDRFGEARARVLFRIAHDSMTALEALIAEESIQCDFERVGHLQAAWKPAHLKAFAAEQALLARVFDHPVHLLSPIEQRAELASPAYHGALVDEQSAAINPAKYVDGLEAAACRAGAIIAPFTAVTGVRPRQGGSWTVATARDEITAHDVLIATNGYTDPAAFPALARRFIPVGSYIIATEPLPAADARALMPRRRVVFDSKHFLYYFRLSADNRLLFGGRAEFTQPTPEATRRAAAVLRKGLTRVFPQVASVRVDYAWSGRVAFTRDQVPHAGKMDEAYYAGGYCGHGIAMATYLGILVGRRVAGESIDHPLFDDRFPAIPFYHGRPWFLPVVGAYYRMRDLR